MQWQVLQTKAFSALKQQYRFVLVSLQIIVFLIEFELNMSAQQSCNMLRQMYISMIYLNEGSSESQD